MMINRWSEPLPVGNIPLEKGEVWLRAIRSERKVELQFLS